MKIKFLLELNDLVHLSPLEVLLAPNNWWQQTKIKIKVESFDLEHISHLGVYIKHPFLYQV